MFRLRLLITLLALPMMLACPGPKSPDVSGGPLDTTNTVYDQAGSDGAGKGMDSERVDTDPDSYYSGEVATDDLDTVDHSSQSDLPNLNWEPIYFQFDEASLTETAKQKLADYANRLINNPSLQVLLEGHCDEQGTEDYNLALGERRAQNVKRYLVERGVRESMMETVSYGELSPLDLRHDESAWSRNRRVAFTF